MTPLLLDDLRKLIIGDFIKNQKTFKGNKGHVNKSIEEIEHLLNITRVLIRQRSIISCSYSLRDDALE